MKPAMPPFSVGRWDDGTRAAVREEYLRSIEGFRSRKGYSIPGEFVIGHGLLPG